jgi:protein CpxP
MRKRTTSAVVGLMIILTAAYASARRAGPGAEGAPGPKGAFMQDLSEEQRTAMREIMEKHREEMEPLRTEMEARNAELQELVRADAGEVAIFGKLDEIGALRTEMMKVRMAMRLEIRAQLTDEQKEQFDEKPFIRGGGRGRPGGGRGPGPGAGGGPFE